MNRSLKLGWREWCALPDLGLPAIKAKVDTGAKTSALHTFRIEPFTDNGIAMVRFCVHPLQRRRDVVRECTAAVKDQRIIADSGGHKELRYVIETRIRIGDKDWPVELSLTDRDTMLFRMLLGRRAMAGKSILIDPGASYLNGRIKARRLYE
jgi:hypothetical protein